MPADTPTEVKVVFNNTSITVDCGNNSSDEITTTDASPQTGNIGFVVDEASARASKMHAWAGYSL